MTFGGFLVVDARLIKCNGGWRYILTSGLTLTSQNGLRRLALNFTAHAHMRPSPEHRPSTVCPTHFVPELHTGWSGSFGEHNIGTSRCSVIRQSP